MLKEFRDLLKVRMPVCVQDDDLEFKKKQREEQQKIKELQAKASQKGPLSICRIFIPTAENGTDLYLYAMLICM